MVLKLYATINHFEFQRNYYGSTSSNLSIGNNIGFMTVIESQVKVSYV